MVNKPNPYVKLIYAVAPRQPSHPTLPKGHTEAELPRPFASLAQVERVSSSECAVNMQPVCEFFPHLLTGMGCSPSLTLPSIQPLQVYGTIFPVNGGTPLSVRCWWTGGLSLTQSPSAHKGKWGALLFYWNLSSFLHIYARTKKNESCVCTDSPSIAKFTLFLLPFPTHLGDDIGA